MIFTNPAARLYYATNGMCATSHPLAAKVAVQMLESGGNAMDAAIAGAVLLGICEPQMTGIGGDCFVLMTPPGEDRVVALNGSGRAPAGIDAEKLRAKGPVIAPYSADAVSIPGAIDAFCRLSKDWGKLGLKALARALLSIMPKRAFPLHPASPPTGRRSVDNLLGPRARTLF